MEEDSISTAQDAGHQHSNVDVINERQNESQPVEEAEKPAQLLSSPERPNRVRSDSGSNSSSTSSVVQNARSSRSAARSRKYSTTTNGDMEQALLDYLERHPTAVSRMEQHRLQHIQTVGSTKTKSDSIDLPDFGGGKPYPPRLPERDQYVVEFSGQDDPQHPQNFKLSTKLYISAIMIFSSLGTTLASSIVSPAQARLENEFHLGGEPVTLSTSLFVLGYAVGPIVFAPLSELYGRRLPVIVAAFGFGIFGTACAVAKDYQTLVICRFFAGVFGSCPVTLCGAVFADIYNNKIRGIAIAIFSGTLMNGPFCGPMIGGFITKSYLGWRFTAWIPSFMGYFAGVLALFFQHETYAPVILVSKASTLRRLTRNWGIHAKQDEVEVDLKELATKNIARPLRILFTEPIVLLVTLYMSFIYGLVYLSLTAYSIVYGGIYGWSLGVAGLPYMAMVIGVLIGLAVIVLTNSSYAKKLEANNNIPIPEWRLPIAMPGGIVFAAGLFWFGWGGYMSSTPWIVPTLAGLFIGYGVFTVFLPCFNYIIDAYLMFAASAIAANTIMRSLFGAVFPLFAAYMFNGIGIEWGMTFLGCVASLFIPMPFIFYRYGKQIRRKSKFAPMLDDVKTPSDEEASLGKEDEIRTGSEADKEIPENEREKLE